ncbi:hypothetical protein [Novosphingobium malaysiense]|uniref:hypothetical protein n=1 Tax=Novosphingobium malaysiense TaxID=1348853 RepID=UPI0038B3BF60
MIGALVLAVMQGAPAAGGAPEPAAVSAPFPPPPGAKPNAPVCVSPEQAAFDFWVGDWDVYPRGKDKLVAHSRIEKLYGGCAIRENWMPVSGANGGSLNSYDPETGKWHQTWVASNPGRVEFEGGPQGNAMVLTGLWPEVLGPGRDALVRMTYTPLDDGSVRQFGEASEDGGKTWQPNFDFVYRPHAAHPAGSETP